MKKTAMFLAIAVLLGLLITSCNPGLLSTAAGSASLVSRGVEPAEMRGVTFPVAWYSAANQVDKLDASFVQAGGYNCFNTTRLVFLNGTSETKIRKYVDLAYANGMMPIYGNWSATVNRIEGDWTNYIEELDKSRDAVIALKSVFDDYPEMPINFSNEWGPSISYGNRVMDYDSTNLNDQQLWNNFNNRLMWVDWICFEALRPIREAGINNPIIIDACGHGQDLDCLLEHGPVLIQNDEFFGNENKLILSVHMYQNFGTHEKLQEAIQLIKSSDLPIIVGEFSSTIYYEELMQLCDDNNIGCIAWSWSGNNNANMDMALADDWTTLTTFGQAVVDSFSGVTPVVSAMYFKDASQWTINPTTADKSDTAEGTVSVTFDANTTYARFTSEAMSSLPDDVLNGDTITIAVKTSADVPWGGVGLILDSLTSTPPQNTNYICYDEIRGFEAGTWYNLSFPLNSTAIAALASGYSDLTLTFAISLPPGSTIEFDSPH